MSISISSDLVLDVMKAANPMRRAAASTKLASPQAVANQKFEAVMLRNMAEDMLPKNSSHLYGEGTAGNIWRSLQADLLSQEMAKAGGAGIARMLDKAQDRVNENRDAANLNAISPQGHLVAAQSSSEWPYFIANDLPKSPQS
jgi:Rod binding domain-containing protein